MTDSEPIAWEEARRILDELKPFYDAGACEDRGVFAEMLDAPAKDGRQPD